MARELPLNGGADGENHPDMGDFPFPSLFFQKV